MLPVVVHLSEVDADKWLPLLHQVNVTKTGVVRPVGLSISDGYMAVSKLTQQQKHLTDDEITRLVADYGGGSTILELAVGFDCDRKTVIRYLKLNCVEMRYRRFTEVEIDKLVLMYESGMSVPEIGRSVDADPRTVHSRLKERGSLVSPRTVPQATK